MLLVYWRSGREKDRQAGDAEASDRRDVMTRRPVLHINTNQAGDHSSKRLFHLLKSIRFIRLWLVYSLYSTLRVPFSFPILFFSFFFFSFSFVHLLFLITKPLADGIAAIPTWLYVYLSVNRKKDKLKIQKEFSQMVINHNGFIVILTRYYSVPARKCPTKKKKEKKEKKKNG